jgi:hypothetical protein
MRAGEEGPLGRTRPAAGAERKRGESLWCDVDALLRRVSELE